MERIKLPEVSGVRSRPPNPIPSPWRGPLQYQEMELGASRARAHPEAPPKGCPPSPGVKPKQAPCTTPPPTWHRWGLQAPPVPGCLAVLPGPVQGTEAGSHAAARTEGAEVLRSQFSHQQVQVELGGRLWVPRRKGPLRRSPPCPAHTGTGAFRCVQACTGVLLGGVPLPQWRACLGLTALLSEERAPPLISCLCCPWTRGG